MRIKDAFWKLGYENGRQDEQTADKSWDGIMREIANEIGLDLHDGRIDIRCDELLQTYDPATNINTSIRGVSRDIQNIEGTDISKPHLQVTHALFRGARDFYPPTTYGQ